MKDKIKIGIYGLNGHQIHNKLKNHPDAVISAVCIPEGKSDIFDSSIPRFDTLEQMLELADVDMVSLCSPKRSDQERDALLCLNFKKHVYAEKPAVLTEEGLDRLLKAAKDNGCEFHEMADTVFYEPYYSARRLVKEGRIGQVIQVYAQKSYPSRFESRPSDELTDGGLVRWVGIHAVRFVEHITGLRVKDVVGYETHLGNGKSKGGIYTASSLAMTLENGAVASVCLNYLKPAGFKGWGNECVRIFGDKGFIEITDGGKHSHVYTDTDEGEINITNSGCEDYFDLLLKHLRFGERLPLEEEEELHPLRVVIRAKNNAVSVQ